MQTKYRINKEKEMVVTKIVYICRVCGKEITDEELIELMNMGEDIDNELEIECMDCLMF